MKIKLIIFDVGGVLSNPRRGEKEPFIIVAKKYGLSLDESMKYFYKYEKEYSIEGTLSRYKFWERTLKNIDPKTSKKEVDKILKIFDEKAVINTSRKMLFLVDKLAKDYKLAIISNSYKDMDKPLYSSNFINYFDGIYLSHVNVDKKPSKKTYKKV